VQQALDCTQRCGVERVNKKEEPQQML